MYEILSSDTANPTQGLTAQHVRTYLTEIAAEEARRSLRRFVQRGWGQLQPGTLVWNWHLDSLCDHLAYVTLGEIRFLMVNIGPRLSKTMVVSVLWPDWHWLHKPGEQFLSAGVDERLVKEAAVQSRRLIEGAWFNQLYPGEIELYDDENQVGMYRNRKGGYRMIASVQGRVTGVGGTIQILDDPHDAKKVESDQVRRQSLSWHDNAWRSRLNNPDTAQKVYVGQRTHANDIFGHVRQQEGNRWCCLDLPTEFNSKKRCITFLNQGEGPSETEIFRDPRQVDLELIEPKRQSAKYINGEKAIMAERNFQAQFNQAPIGIGGLILKRHWWRPWIEPEWRPNAGQRRSLPKFREIIQVWDTAFEEEEENDYSARTTWGLFLHKEQSYDPVLGRAVEGSTRMCAMLLDAFHDRLNYPDLREKAIQGNTDFQPDQVLIERKASGHSLLQELKRKHVPVKAVKLDGSAGKGGRSGDLIARAHEASLMLEKGCIFYPPEPFAYEVLDETAEFPNGDHDDYVATCVIAWMYMRRFHDLQLPDDEKDVISPWAWKKLPPKRYA